MKKLTFKNKLYHFLKWFIGLSVIYSWIWLLQDEVTLNTFFQPIMREESVFGFYLVSAAFGLWEIYDQIKINEIKFLRKEVERLKEEALVNKQSN